MAEDPMPGTVCPPVSHDISSSSRHRLAEQRDRSSGLRHGHEQQLSVQEDHPSKRKKPAFHLPSLGRVIRTKFDPSKFAAGRPCYLARNAPEEDHGNVKEECLESLRAKSWTYIRWDGHEMRPILDRRGRSFAILGGIPGGETYQDHCRKAHAIMSSITQSEPFTQPQKRHKRGGFSAFTMGIGMGPGLVKPHNLALPPSQSHLATNLREDPSILHLAEAQDAIFEKWVPRLHAIYDSLLAKLLAKDKDLHKNFECCVWPAVTFNFGKVCTKRHRDGKNLLHGICAITSLGNFDHTMGGHLVLPDLEMVIEFPSGAVILIPSALLLHANTPVQADEARLSFTQYGAGGLFRFVDWGFNLVKSVQAANPREYSKLRAKNADNAAKGWDLYSTLAELREYSV